MKTAFDLFKEAWADVIKDYDVGKYSAEIDLQLQVNRLTEENKRFNTALCSIANGAEDPMDIAHIALCHPELSNEYSDHDKK